MAQVGPYQGILLKQTRVYNRLFWFGTTGQTLTVKISKNGGNFGTAAGAVTEVSFGWYYVALTVVDTGTAGDLAYHITASSGGPLDFSDTVVPQLFTDLLINAAGSVTIASNIKQNVALNGFSFTMTDITTHQPVTNLTVVAQRSLGGAGFAPCANAVTEIANGDYTINLASTDLNSPTVMLRFTATGADDLNIFLITQP